VFSGEYVHSVDVKGRIIMPSKFREALGETFIITKGLDKSLFVFSKQEWEKFYEKLSSLPMTNSNSRAFVRLFLAGAAEVSADKQGRVLLPQNLRTYSCIEIGKDVTVTGNGSKIEIWSTDVWNEYIDGIDADQIAENMDNLGMMI
jgi:MraZ protein